MFIEVKVPVFSESISEATVGNLIKKAGDYISEDEILCELETDKTVLEIHAPISGVIKSIAVSQGDTVQSECLIATIEEKKEKDNVILESESTLKTINKNTNNEEIDNNSVNNDTNYIKSSPSARQKAVVNDLDINKLHPSGMKNVITKLDVCANDKRGERVVKLSKLRKVIAKRLKDTQNTAAILTTFNEINMKNVIDLRTKYKDIFQKKHDIKLGFMSFFAKASALALKEIPEVNAQIDGENIIYKDYCDISVAVSTSKGLFVPVLRNVENMSFACVESTIMDFATKAKNGTLTMDDMKGGTFTITNGGVFGSMLSTPIINPPQSAILGLHATKERAWVENGELVIRPVMYIALSYDHRIIDGKEAVTFLKRVKELIEDPASMMLEV